MKKQFVLIFAFTAIIFASTFAKADEAGEGDAEYHGKSSFTEDDYEKSTDLGDFGGSEPTYTGGGNTDGGGETTTTVTTGSVGTSGEGSTPPGDSRDPTSGGYVPDPNYGGNTSTPPSSPSGGSTPDSDRKPASGPDSPSTLESRYPKPAPPGACSDGNCTDYTY